MTVAPRTWISPDSMRTSIPWSGAPDPGSPTCAGVCVATWEHASVQPYVDSTGIPRDTACIRSASGNAAPPTKTARRAGDGPQRGSFEASSRRSIVGTTLSSVTASRSNLSMVLAGSNVASSKTTQLRAIKQRVRIDKPPTWAGGIARSQRSSGSHPRLAACADSEAMNARRGNRAPRAVPRLPDV